MSERQLYLLSPYRLPTHHQISLNEDEMAAWLNGMICLWHPALIFGAKEPPKVDSCYDHEMPSAGQVFAIPSAPPLFQPDDWPYRVLNAGAIRFEAAADRQATLANLKQALREAIDTGEPDAKASFGTPEIEALLALPAEQVRPFLGLGFGYLMIESLFDAMDHEHLLSVEDFWNDIQAALAAMLRPDGQEEVQQKLKDAAGRLLAAREILYPIAVHVLDILFLDADKLDELMPAAFGQKLPLNIVATGQTLEALAGQYPETIALWKERLSVDVQPPQLEIVGGHVREREDALLPLESQIWNFEAGKAIIKRLFGVEVQVYGRRRMALHPQTPLLLGATGFRHALFMNFDASVIPNHRATVVNWASPDGRSIDAFTRVPIKAHKPETFFNLVYSLHQSISNDSAPTLALSHEGQPAFAMYDDWLALNELSFVFGEWTTFSRYFSDAMAGEYAGAANVDDFFPDYLEERVNAHRRDPVSAFARQARLRRQIDAAHTYAAIHRVMLTPTEADDDAIRRLLAAETTLETEGLDGVPEYQSPAEQEVLKIGQEFADKLCARLQGRAAENQPGTMLLNPCPFPRRVALELDPVSQPFTVEGPVKAAQFDADKLRVVVEVPPLGFAWLPREGRASPPKARLKLADEFMVRNEFFEAEIDPLTGGLRAIRDLKTRIPRLGQQLVFNPGSKMEAKSVTITANGPALGEITAEGVIVDEQNQPLATFKQRFRAWLNRPMLDIRIEIEPTHAPSGYPWHSYYAARFAWREERAGLMRGVLGVSNQTNHTRPQSPEYLEVRNGKQNTLIFTGGLPFHQRHGSRMVDVILQPEGEATRVFELGLALDRENHLQTSLGFTSPVAIVPTSKGPPHIGPSGWLFHVDAPNLVMTSLKPVLNSDGIRRLNAHFLESTGYSGSAEVRCVRNPSSAYTLDGEGTTSTELPITGDAIRIDFSANDFQRVQIDFA